MKPVPRRRRGRRGPPPPHLHQADAAALGIVAGRPGAAAGPPPHLCERMKPAPRRRRGRRRSGPPTSQATPAPAHLGTIRRMLALSPLLTRLSGCLFCWGKPVCPHTCGGGGAGGAATCGVHACADAEAGAGARRPLPPPAPAPAWCCAGACRPEPASCCCCCCCCCCCWWAGCHDGGGGAAEEATPAAAAAAQPPWPCAVTCARFESEAAGRRRLAARTGTRLPPSPHAKPSRRAAMTRDRARGT